MRAAQAQTGIAAADFSRLRKADPGRFTIDRLIRILSVLGQDVEVSVNVHPRRATAPAKQYQLLGNDRSRRG